MAVLDWFDDSGNAAFAAFVLASISIVVSIIAILKSHRTQQRLRLPKASRERVATTPLRPRHRPTRNQISYQ